MHVGHAYLDVSLPPCDSPGEASTRRVTPFLSKGSFQLDVSWFLLPDSRFRFRPLVCAKWRAFCGRDDHSSCQANWLTVCAISGAARTSWEDGKTYV